MKKIIITKTSISELHNLWKNYLKKPPEGYKYFNLRNQKLEFKNKKLDSNKNLLNKLICFLFKIRKKIPFLIILTKTWSDKKISKNIDKLNPDLVYCLNGRLYYGKLPWIVDFENPTAFTAYSVSALKKHKKKLIKIFKRKNCKAIIAYSITGKESFQKIFQDREINKKVIISKNCVSHIPSYKKIEHKTFNLLFTGSSNQTDHFYLRGGRELILAFLKVSKKYKDIKLILRCQIPEKYKQILKNKNVEIYENVLSDKNFKNLFKISDIYILPAYIGYALSNIEAMSYGLPIITSDLLENGEVLTNCIEGFKIKPPEIKYVLPKIPNYYANAKIGKNLYTDKKYINLIANKIEYLYLNRNILKQMSLAARDNIICNYSITIKNKSMKDIYDYALKK